MGQTQSGKAGSEKSAESKVSEGVSGSGKKSIQQSSTDLSVAIYDKIVKYMKTLLVADVESLYQPETDIKLKVYFGGMVDNYNIIDISSTMNTYYERSLILPNASGGFTPRSVIIDYLIKMLNRWIVYNTYDDVELSYLTDNLAKACISCLFQKDKVHTFDPDKSIIQLIDKSELLGLVENITNINDCKHDNTPARKKTFIRFIFNRLYKFDLMSAMVEINKKVEESREIVRENIKQSSKLSTKNTGEGDTAGEESVAAPGIVAANTNLVTNPTIQPSAPSESAIYGSAEEEGRSSD
jgi:hypothetical protein